MCQGVCESLATLTAKWRLAMLVAWWNMAVGNVATINGMLEFNYVDVVMVLSYSAAYDVIGIIR